MTFRSWLVSDVDVCGVGLMLFAAVAAVAGVVITTDADDMTLFGQL